ncbi:hypothetical protein [Blastococcus sp. PRF04-17]|uniref:hypothetical protein n=1 Tax=Blastococcus sp. PRF04-17 TaxID=2933797 RepID=UPI001FF5064F|nr:hypothetical protein [Blastococcus sp. PRF04-17]UOX99770.1 hypothetical protein MVA48_11985 [Blastococcus sp. PRF04-17]
MTGGKAQPNGRQAGTVAPPARDRRRLLLLAAAAAVLVAALVALVVVLGNDDDEGTTNAAATGATSSSARDTSVIPPPPTPTPTGPTGNVDELPPALPEVALDAPAAVGNGVVATLPSIESIQGTAVGPGNVAGPALRITVRIENGTDEPIWLDGVAVNTYYGEDRSPASPLDDPSRRPFGGRLESGASGEGVYVFSVPTDVRDLVTIEVGYQAGAPLLLFTGAVD